ncbi:deoxyribonuclease V [Desulfosediminicola sp.]|uniref:deoxyribonuclease V n=1 Tax=Desulfosediminicola sp. TaxID=2886825 RepID=UPI003AF29E71
MKYSNIWCGRVEMLTALFFEQLIMKKTQWHFDSTAISPKEAVRLQRELQQQVIVKDQFDTIELVAGVDVGFDKASNRGRAAVAVLRYDDLTLVESAVAESELTFPYVPGLLSFRELPVVLKALEHLSVWPDIFLCDGQGIAHPRRFGIACHLGCITGIPALGVGKSRLCGSHEEVGEEKGSLVELRDGDEVIGAVVRTRRGVKPIYVSPGHKISLETAIKVVLKCVTKYKLPETTRSAHALSLFNTRSRTQGQHQQGNGFYL